MKYIAKNTKIITFQGFLIPNAVIICTVFILLQYFGMHIVHLIKFFLVCWHNAKCFCKLIMLIIFGTSLLLTVDAGYSPIFTFWSQHVSCVAITVMAKQHGVIILLNRPVAKISKGCGQ